MIPMKMLAVVAMTLMAVPASAQEASDLSDTGVLDALQEAIDASDEARVLELMQEAESRGLTIEARGGAPRCEQPVVPKVGALEHPFRWGMAKQAHGIRLRQLAMEQGYCGCLSKLMDFAEFTQERTGKAPETLTEGDLTAIREWYHGIRGEIREPYIAYRNRQCGD